MHSTLNIDKILQKKLHTIAIIDSNLAWILDYGLKLQLSGTKVIIGYTTSFYDHNLTFYVKNELGYKNLCSIYTHGFTFLSKIDGLICTMASYNKEFILKLYEMFNTDLYILVNSSSIEEILLADELNIHILADHTICHIDESDYLAYKTIRAIDTDKYLIDIEDEECSWLSSEEIYNKYMDIPDAIYNTYTLAQKCYFQIKEHPLSLPVFISENEIAVLAKSGLVSKELHENTMYVQRLEYELSIIQSMGFEGYFLIVSDFVMYAKQNNIPVGPGRGSGAGSLVAWCLGITDIDPIKMGLFFERFLNPHRVSMPDFDIDFCPFGREKIIQYLQNKYGYSHVAHISAFGRLQTKAALRDVARVLSIPFPAINNICNMIPFIPVKPLTISDALDLQNIKDEIENDLSLIELFDIAKQIEGLHRHESIHAAGVVISHAPLLEYIPTKIDSDSKLVVSYEVNNIEKAGLVKFDLLGLKNLTIIQKVSELVDINIKDILLDDIETFALLSSGYTHGIFQLEGKAMRDILTKLKVSRLEEIIAVVALYRPGPMSSIPQFINNKYNPAQIEYAYPEMQDILQETFGIIVYQEQVLQIAQKIAGYTVGEADLLRRAMGKKKPQEMAIHREKFINGVLQNSHDHDAQKAENLFETIAKFAGYAFCKAHAAPYGLISYQTAYLKAHYKYEFIQVMLNINIHNTEELENIIYNTDCIIKKPSINFSNGEFTIHYDQDGNKYILYGLYAIKNIGLKSLDEILSNQSRNFRSIKDISNINLNKGQWENLIFSGALDELIESRKEMLDYVIHIHTHSISKKTLFDISAVTTDITQNQHIYSLEELLLQEKKSLGLVLSVLDCDLLYNLIGFKIGIVSKSEKMKNGLYKLCVVYNRTIYTLINKTSVSDIIVYKKNMIYGLTQFMQKIQKLVVRVLSEYALQLLSNLRKGCTELYIYIGHLKYYAGKFHITLQVIVNSVLLDISY